MAETRETQEASTVVLAGIPLPDMIFIPASRSSQLVEVQAGCGLEASARSELHDSWPRPASCRPRRIRGRAGLRQMGRQGSAERSGMGFCCARGAGRRDVRMGGGAHTRRPSYGEHLAGRLSLAQRQGRRIRAHITGRQLSAERLRRPRHDRERVGVDVRLVRAAPRRRSHEDVLRSSQPERGE